MSTPASLPATAALPHGLGRALARRPELFTLGLLITLCAYVGLANPDFFQLATFYDLARDSVVTGLFALGVLVVLAAGGLDVSFTAIAALSMYAVTKLAITVFPGMPLVVAFGLSVALGLGLGLLNGLMVYALRVPALIVTIGAQYLYRGFLLTFIGTVWIEQLPPQLDNFGKVALASTVSAEGAIIILPAFFLILPACAAITWWILRYTLLGRAIFAAGGSSAIAERLGFSRRTITLFIFGYAGALAGLAGIIHTCSNRLSNPSDLVGTEIDVIAAVVLGGARITGGSGSVIGTLLGVFLIVVINNTLIMAGVPSTWQRVVVGGFILIAGALLVRRGQK
ncbi:MAG: branched-chain amino acid transport system / permease component family protein [Caulobacteraceae bacterium]|nr:branched-chain amino acid transport system / permease component family protein [Caulobacteraceae bacterium]